MFIYTYGASTQVRDQVLAAVTSKFLNINRYLFDDYQDLVLFILILLSSKHNEG